MSNSPNPSDSLLTALLCGTTAAASVATLTYPLDSLKTQQQLTNDARLRKYKLQHAFSGSLAQVYRGGSALVVGLMFKNSARLVSYNWLSKFMAIDTHDNKGNKQKTSAPRLVIAGAMSAFIETLWVIPFENVKITMIQNMLLANEKRLYADKKHGHTHTPKYISTNAYLTHDTYLQLKGKPVLKFTSKHSANDVARAKFNERPSSTFSGTVREMYAARGLQAFTAGTCITFVRQTATSFVWLSTYNATRQWIDPHKTDDSSPSWFGHKHTAVQLMGLHVLLSIGVIATTQPIDVIKSHMQSKNGKLVYRDSLHTAFKLFVEQGPRKMYSGAVPRALKVLVSGGLTLAVYSAMENAVGVVGGQSVFGE